MEFLTKAAETDSLSGLLDHEASMRHMDDFLNGDGKFRYHALFMVDIDNFKSANDVLGHQAGDETIKRVSQIIRDLFRHDDIVGRVGGDEFLILMKDISDPGMVNSKSGELVDALRLKLSNEKNELELTVSVGASAFRAGNKTMRDLYAEVDSALYDAKEAGRDRFCVFTPDEEVFAGGTENEPEEYTDMVHYYTILEHMNAGIVVAEVDEKKNSMKITYTSPSCFKLMRRTAEEIGERGEKLLEVIHPDDVYKLYDAAFDMVRNRTTADIVYRVDPPESHDGKYEWRHIRGTALPREPGKPDKVIVVMTDINEVKSKEKKSKIAEMKCRKVVEQSDILAWALDIDEDEVNFCGKKAVRLGLAGGGYKVRPGEAPDIECLGKDGKTAADSVMTDIYEGKGSGEYVIGAREKDGEPIDVKVCYELLRDDVGEPVSAVGTVTRI